MDESRSKRLVNALRENDIESGQYHFDVNRNMLKPQFVKCVPVPCHQGISETELARIIEITTKVLRS
jgi:hypothetical protein